MRLRARSFTVPLIAFACTAVLIAAVVSLRSDDRAGPCIVTQPETLLPDIPEASGLAISRRTPGILWSHNDSGNAAVLFALDAVGALRGRVRVPIVTRDWEDISAARCPAGDCLYIADIGDNSRTRTRVRIYRVPEPLPGDAETPQPEMFTATYIDGAHNAEALFVIGDNLFVVTRDRTGGLYRSTPVRTGGGELTLEQIGQLGLAAVTDAEATADDKWVVVRTSKAAVIYRTADVIRGGTVSSTLQIPIDALREPQGEGVALGTDGMLYLASEGRPWNRAGRLITLRCALSVQ